MRLDIAIGIAVGFVALIGGCFAAVEYMDARHTPHHRTHTLDVTLQELAGSFKQFAVEQNIRNLRSRLWQLQDRFGKDCGPAKSECRYLINEISRLERRLKRPRR